MAGQKALCLKRRRLTPYPDQSTGKALALEELPTPRMLQGGKGVWTMTFSDVAILLTLLGGAIFVTFQITWTIAHEHHDDKKRKKK